MADLEATRLRQPAVLSASRFEDFTSGYDTNSAVLFPETVAVREVPERFSWGGIFCDREAARFRRVGTAAVDLLGVEVPDDVRGLLEDQQRSQDAFVLWDMIHDRAHSHGDLPFDPFMIKQRMPFCLYSLEELRCDLTAFRAAVELEAEGNGGRCGTRSTRSCFDRMFRFPVTGEPHPQLRRTRRPAALRLPAPARRDPLDRQQARASTGTSRPR